MGPVWGLILVSGADLITRVASRLLIEVVGDFIRQENQPWTYYVGYGASQAVAVATGENGAAARFYTVARFVDLTVLKAPEGGLVNVLINGALWGTLDLFNPVPEWAQIAIELAPELWNQMANVELNVSANPAATGGFNTWFALGDVSARDSGGGTTQLEDWQSQGGTMADYNIISFSLKDSESDGGTTTVPVYMPQGKTIAQYEAYANAFAPKLDAVSGAQVLGASLTVNLTLNPSPALKGSPVAGSYNERGGLITFDTDGPRADSFRIPAILPALMSGASFSLANADIAALITLLTVEQSLGGTTMRALSSNGYTLTAARRAAKSVRRQ